MTANELKEKALEQAGTAKVRAMLRMMMPSTELTPLANTIIDLVNKIKELEDNYPKIRNYSTRQDYFRACLDYEKKIK